MGSLRSTHQRGKKAFALVVVITMIVAVMMFVAATGALVQQNLNSGVKAEQKMQAKYAAAAGLRYALVELNANPDWEPPGGVLVGTVDFVDAGLGYEVMVVNNYRDLTDPPNPPKLRPDGGYVPDGKVWLHADGTIDGKKLLGNYGLAERLAEKPDVIFEYALYETRGGLNPKDADVASYSSDPAASPPVPYAFVPGNASTYRHDTKLRANASFSMEGTGWLDGAVLLPAPECLDPLSTSNFTGDASGQQIVYDPIVPRKLRFNIPVALRTATPATPPSSGTIAGGRYSDLNVPAGGSVTLQRGQTYVFDSVTLGDNASIVVAPGGTFPDDACVVYARLSFVIGDHCAVNTPTIPFPYPPPTRPREFQLYTTDESTSVPYGAGTVTRSTEVRLGAFSAFTGVIAGHGAVVTNANNSTVYGAMTVGRETWGGGASIKYDISLLGEKLAGDSDWVLAGEGDD